MTPLPDTFSGVEFDKDGSLTLTGKGEAIIYEVASHGKLYFATSPGQTPFTLTFADLDRKQNLFLLQRVAHQIDESGKKAI